LTPLRIEYIYDQSKIFSPATDYAQNHRKLTLLSQGTATGAKAEADAMVKRVTAVESSWLTMFGNNDCSSDKTRSWETKTPKEKIPIDSSQIYPAVTHYNFVTYS
jgi:hypothetical protein